MNRTIVIGVLCLGALTALTLVGIRTFSSTRSAPTRLPGTPVPLPAAPAPRSTSAATAAPMDPGTVEAITARIGSLLEQSPSLAGPGSLRQDLARNIADAIEAYASGDLARVLEMLRSQGIDLPPDWTERAPRLQAMWAEASAMLARSSFDPALCRVEPRAPADALPVVEGRGNISASRAVRPGSPALDQRPGVSVILAGTIRPSPGVEFDGSIGLGFFYDTDSRTWRLGEIRTLDVPVGVQVPMLPI